ncbi:unnamed protein product, partial [Mesorhabditis spiculigera]
MPGESNFVIEDQILGTSITWEMVETDFQKAFEVPSRCGPNRDARMIENGEKGNTSLLIRADFDWDTKEEVLPKTALLKIISCDKFKSVGANNAQMNFRGEKERAAWMHNAEWNLYERARECPEFAEIAKLPAYYCGRAFDEALEAGYLAMEFLEGAVCLPAYGVLGVDEVKQLVHLSSATEDISKFISASLSPVDYQNSKAELLRYYYKTMEKEVKHHLLPWKGHEEFLQEHEKCMPLMGLISLPIAFYYEDKIFRDFPGATSEKEAAQELFRDKLFSSLDEIEAAVKKHYI